MSTDIARAVAEKLNKYLAVTRKEESFDLTDAQHPFADHLRVKPRSKLSIKGPLNKVEPTRKTTKQKSLNNELRYISQTDAMLSDKEFSTKMKLEREMSKLKSRPGVLSPYAEPLTKPQSNSRPQSCKSRTSVSRALRRRSSAGEGRLEKNPPVLRRSPPQKISTKERERIVNMTTKLLVATETIALPANRKQTREIQTGVTTQTAGGEDSDEEMYTQLPSVRRLQQRPKSGTFSDPGPPGTPGAFLKTIESRAQSAEQDTANDISSTDDDNTFRRHHPRPPGKSNKSAAHSSLNSSPLILSQTSSLSTSATHSPKRQPHKKKLPALQHKGQQQTIETAVQHDLECPPNDLIFGDEEGFLNRSSTDFTPTPRAGWLDPTEPVHKTEISTQTNVTTGTQTFKGLNREESFEEKVVYPGTSYYNTSEIDRIVPVIEQPLESGKSQTVHAMGIGTDTQTDGLMDGFATQTRRRDLEPKVVTYEIYIVTGNKLGSGTKSDVRVTLYGEYGDSGERPVAKSRTNAVAFQRNQVDLFHLDSVFLGSLSRIRVGHNGVALGTGWFLEKIVAKEGDKATRAFEFECNRWLSSREDDGQTVRDIALTKQIPATEVPEPCKAKDYFQYRRLSVSSDDGGLKVAHTSNMTNEAKESRRVLDERKERKERKKKSKLGQDAREFFERELKPAEDINDDILLDVGPPSEESLDSPVKTAQVKKGKATSVDSKPPKVPTVKLISKSTASDSQSDSSARYRRRQATESAAVSESSKPLAKSLLAQMSKEMSSDGESDLDSASEDIEAELERLKEEKRKRRELRKKKKSGQASRKSENNTDDVVVKPPPGPVANFGGIVEEGDNVDKKKEKKKGTISKQKRVMLTESERSEPIEDVAKFAQISTNEEEQVDKLEVKARDNETKQTANSDDENVSATEKKYE